MATTDEIVVSGKNFIERRIFVHPQLKEVEDLQNRAYTRGYKCGWVRGFLAGLGLFGATALCMWLALRW